MAELAPPETAPAASTLDVATTSERFSPAETPARAHGVLEDELEVVLAR